MFHKILVLEKLQERLLEVLEKSLNFTQICLYEPCPVLCTGLFTISAATFGMRPELKLKCRLVLKSP